MDRAKKSLWTDLWATPQSTAWEILGWTRMVARYAQVVLICEGPHATAAMLGEVRQMEDRLGLSPMAMRRLQWEIVDDSGLEHEAVEVTVLNDYRSL